MTAPPSLAGLELATVERAAPPRARPRRPERHDSWVMAVLATALLAALATAWRPDQWTEFGIAGGLLLAAALLCGLANPVWSRSWPAVVVAVPALIGLLQLAFHATASPAVTQGRVIRWLAVAAVCLLTAGVRGGAQRSRLLDALAVTGAATAALAGVQAYTSSGRVFWWIDTPLSMAFGPFLNRNHFSAFCELLFPLAAWRAVERPGWRRWPPAVIALAGILSGSRAGVALLSLEVALLGAWAVSPRAGLSRIRSLGWMAAALAGIPLLAVALGGEPLLQRLRESEPLLYRDQIWAASLDLIAQHPVAGHGLGTFALVYPAAARFDTGEIVHRAHCDWLEWWVEGGVAVPLVLAGLLLWTCRRTLTAPWLAGVPMILLHSLVDYPLDKLPILLLLGSLVTLAVGGPAPQKSREKPHRGV